LDLGAGNLIDLRGFLQDLQDSRKDLKFTRKDRGLTAKRRGSSSSFGQRHTAGLGDSIPSGPATYELGWLVSYGPPWAHYLGGYQDRLLGGPLGLPDLRCTAPDGVKHKDYRGEVLD
jgi:hypothetical protein